MENNWCNRNLSWVCSSHLFAHDTLQQYSFPDSWQSKLKLSICHNLQNDSFSKKWSQFMRYGFLDMTLRPNNNPLSGKVHTCQDKKKHAKSQTTWRACSLFQFDWEWIVHWEFILLCQTVIQVYLMDVLRCLQQTLEKRLRLGGTELAAAPPMPQLISPCLFARNKMSVAPHPPTQTWNHLIFVCFYGWKRYWIAEGTWKEVEKQVPGMFSNFAEALVLLYSCRSDLLWRGQHSINHEVSHFCFIPLVPERFDFTSYCLVLLWG